MRNKPFIAIFAIVFAILIFATAGCSDNNENPGDKTEFSYAVAYAESFTADELPFDASYASSMRVKSLRRKSTPLRN